MENLPILERPHTPPPASLNGNDIGLGIDVHDSPIKQSFTYDPRNLSPEHVRRGPPVNTGMLTPEFTPSYSMKPSKSVDTPMAGQTIMDEEEEENDEAPTSPFNFTTQQYTVGRSPGGAKGEMGRRKGHKYKHSSISHQIFQAPSPRAPIQLPTSLPMPTRKEVQHSLTAEQKSRLAWCACHFAVAAYVQWSAHGSMAMTALSRLLFFDASGAVICVFVDMMGNFEVWKRSSLRHPFGLERADVLAGFGMAVFIAFMGLDVLSHGIEHALEHQGGHVPHSAHGNGRASAGSVDFAAIGSIVATLVSSVLLKNHERIGRAMRFQLIPGGGRTFGNPSHFMTLTCSVLLLLLPFLGSHAYTIFDTLLSAGMAIMMIAFGARLGTSLASMLLMSYSGPGGVRGVREIMAEIEADPLVAGIDEARFWQVHYGMGMANLKLRHKGQEYGDDLAKIKDKIAHLIRTRLGGEGNNGLHWEITTQLVMDGA